MNSGTSWGNSTGFAQNQSAAPLNLFGNSSGPSSLGAKSASMANLGSLNNTSNTGTSSSFLNPTSNQLNNVSGGFSLGPSAQSGGLFGNSGSSNTGNNNNTGGLFGYSNTTGTTGGGLFGNSSNITGNSTQNQNTGLFGSSSTNTAQPGGLLGNLNTNAQSGGLFGNTNSNTSANQSSGIFGNTNNNAASAQTNGGLFGGSGASTATGGLFGNSSTSNQSGGLFGTANTSQPSGGLFGSSNKSNTAGGLFSNAASSNTATGASGGLFGSGNKPPTSGLFGGSNTGASSGGLFGNSSSNGPSGLLGATNGGLFSNSNNAASSGLFNNSNAQTLNTTTNADPYKSNSVISSIAKGEFTMPQSITEFLFDNKPTRRQSQIEPKPKLKKSSLLGKLAQTFNIFRASSNPKSSTGLANFKGIFTQQNYISDTPRANSKNYSIEKKRPASTNLKLGNRNLGDVRKLIIKSKPSQFHLIDADKILSSKRRRIAEPLDSRAIEMNVLTDEESSDEKPVSRSIAPKASKQTQEPVVESKQPNVQEDFNGYFCSPTTSELSAMPKEQLASVFNFIVGRVGHGQIAYNFPVDLLTLYEKCGEDITIMQQELFGKIIKIDKTVVRAYDDPEVESPPMGCELNVPATITLVAPPNANSSIENHIKRLQNITGMDFVTYDPILYHWTFKVKHFSVWGLIDDGEDEADEVNENKRLREIKKQQDENEDEANATYSKLYESSEYRNELKRQKVVRQTSGLPGGWQFDSTVITDGGDVSLLAKQQLVQSEINQEVNQFKEGQSARVRASNASDITGSEDESETDSLDEIMNESVLPTEPRKYEYLKQIVSAVPSSGHFEDIIDEKAYEPDIEDEQAFDMVKFAPAIPSSKDWILQLELANAIDSALSPAVVVDESRLALQAVNDILFNDLGRNPVNVDQASTPIKDKSTPQLLEAPLGGLNKNSMINIVQNVLINSSVETRSNGTPQLTFSEKVTLDMFANLLSQDEENDFLQLASILFDSRPLAHDPKYAHVDVTNIPVVKRLEILRQRNSFSLWLKRFLSKNESMSTDPLDKMLYYVCSGNLKNAVETALSSGNLHLSSLLTVLDLNDDAVLQLAKDQLKAWSAASATALVPSQIIDIHKILAGQYEQLSLSPVSDMSLALRVFYGNPVEKIEVLVAQTLDSLTTSKLKDLLSFFSLSKNESYDEAARVLSGSLFSLKFKWILFQTSGLNLKMGRQCDSTTQRFADHLESAGLWKEAVAVASSLLESLDAQNSIRQIILRNIHLMQSSQEIDDEKFLVTVLKVPRSLIYEAISIEKRSQKDYWGCCEALVTAELWEEAHEVICSELGPVTVIENDSVLVAHLFSLIEKFPNRGAIIPSWSQGAGLFAKYFEVLEAYEDGLLIGYDDVLFLLDNTALSSVADNFTARVASKVLSRKVGDIAIENRAEIPNIDEKINALKLGENEKTYLTSRLISA